MSLSAIGEPTVLISAGVALLIGFSWLKIRSGAAARRRNREARLQADTHECINEYTDKSTDGYTDGYTDERTDERVDERVDEYGYTDRRAGACTGAEYLPSTADALGEMVDRLEEEKREINRLLDEARRTTSRLEEMIHSFEQTFCGDQSPHSSVAALFDGLSDSMLGQCRAITERTGQIRLKAQSLQAAAQTLSTPGTRS